MTRESPPQTSHDKRAFLAFSQSCYYFSTHVESRLSKRRPAAQCTLSQPITTGAPSLGEASAAGTVVVAVEIERSSKANHPQLVLVVVRLTTGCRARLAAVAGDAAVGAPPQHTCMRAARGGRGEATALATRVAAEHGVMPRGERRGRATGPVQGRAQMCE